jgi:3-deoxy-D-manno-octulosonate 8-phosphate phosphatase (KDO 8-P phosphatase)
VNLKEICQPIELILSDVDGVLTDGGVVYDNQGIETKRFHVRDGMGIKLWQKAGFQFGLVTQRSSQIVQIRAGELGISLVRQGVENKLRSVLAILDELQLTPQQVAFIGDDLSDLAPLRIVGLGAAVADAVPELREAADVVASTKGGDGAVREIIELILKSQNRWDETVRSFDAV